jgi:hypothetical protein
VQSLPCPPFLIAGFLPGPPNDNPNLVIPLQSVNHKMSPTPPKTCCLGT